MMVTVLYSCRVCGALDRPVEVKAREPDQDLMLWMTAVQIALGADHATRACHSPVCDLKIPLPKDADYLGQPTKQ